MSGSRRAADAPPAGSPGDRRPPLLAGAAWLGAWAGTSGEVTVVVVAGVLALLLCTAGWWSRRWLQVATGAALLASVAIGGARVWLAGTGPLADWAREGAVVTVDARLGTGRTSDTGPGGPVWIADAVVLAVQGRGEAWTSGATVRVSASGALLPDWAAVPTGAIVRAAVRLSPAAAAEPVSAWARARASPQVLAPPGPVDAAVTTIRAGLRQSVAALPENPRALVPALVVGDTDAMPTRLQDDFRTTGLTHLTAVSGANLAYLLVVLVWASGRLGATGWWRRGLAGVGVLGFVLLCRAEPSVLRAAAMGVVGLAALGRGGSRQGLRLLSWAVIGLLLADPWLCRSIGFVLSVCASAGIILWASRWAGMWSWVPRWLAEAVTVPIAAQVATQPVVTAISGQVSLAGIVANLVAAPLVGPATVWGFVAAAISVVSPWLAAAAGWMAGGFAQALCVVAEAGAALPGASVAWPVSPASLAVLAGLCLAVPAGLPLLWRRPWLVGMVAVSMVAVLLRPVSVPGWPPEAWQVVSCDVGQGDATVVAAGQGRAIVVDTGPAPRLVDRCLDQLGITEVAWLVLTHLHADHIGGVEGVASGRKVDRLLFSGVAEPTSGWSAVLQELPGVPRTVAVPGTVVAAGETRVEVLAVRPYVATGTTGEDSADQNDSSLVLRAEVGGLRVLLAGDVEEAGQANALATASDLSADVLVVPHHGSAHQSPAFLGAVKESVALVSVGVGNDYGHPAARTVAAVTGTDAQVFRTDVHGSVAVVRDGPRLRVTTQRGG